MADEQEQTSESPAELPKTLSLGEKFKLVFGSELQELLRRVYEKIAELDRRAAELEKRAEEIDGREEELSELRKQLERDRADLDAKIEAIRQAADIDVRRAEGRAEKAEQAARRGKNES